MSRIRFQLLGGVLFGVIAPVILRGQFERLPDQIANYDNSLFGTFAALLLGFLIFRKVTTLPGSNAFSNILPAFLTSYGAIIAIFFILRLDYSRAQFLASFVLVTLWFYTTMFMHARFRRPRFGFVSGNGDSELKSLPGVSMIKLSSPRAAERISSMPLVVDFDSPNLDAKWERYLADQAVNGRLIYNAGQFVESLKGRVRIQRLSQNSFGHLAPDSLYSPAKLYLDTLAAMLVLVALLPMLLMIALWIRLDSQGPAIFKQERMGYRGKPFTLYKFRSMRVGLSTDTDEPVPETDKFASMTTRDDHRITRVGRFIRHTRIDELPQIVNILKGEMSWIGPRPETMALSAWYDREIPFYNYRHIVRPGITGWAQVKQGHVTSVDDVREKLEYDFFYVKHFSIWIDVLIVIKTVGVVVTGSGAK